MVTVLLHIEQKIDLAIIDIVKQNIAIEMTPVVLVRFQ